MEVVDVKFYGIRHRIDVVVSQSGLGLGLGLTLVSRHANQNGQEAFEGFVETFQDQVYLRLAVHRYYGFGWRLHKAEGR